MQLLRLKTKNYQQFAAIEIVLIFFVLIMSDAASLFNQNAAQILIATVLLILELVYLLLIFQLAKFLYPSSRFAILLGIGISIVCICTFIALNPFVVFFENTLPWLLAAHVILCSIECFVIGLGLRDIYSSQLHIAERLWGSVALYLLIALGWASFYEIVLLVEPASFGTYLEPGYQSYAESLYFSLCAISGTGSVYTSPSHLIRNLALLEAVWGVLFLVMLIGRLFSLPSSDK